jgi:hypothetical protein
LMVGRVLIRSMLSVFVELVRGRSPRPFVPGHAM